MVSGHSGDLSSRFSSHGPLVCQYCSDFVALRNQEYLDIMDEYQAVMCPSCKEKVKESLATTRCMSCEQPFTYSMYNVSLKGASVPPVCRSCEQGEVWKFID
jgi:NAD-dependent SIR2 family protein deacetylase